MVIRKLPRNHAPHSFNKIAATAAITPAKGEGFPVALLSASFVSILRERFQSRHATFVKRSVLVPLYKSKAFQTKIDD